jgi:hypothetical protein
MIHSAIDHSVLDAESSTEVVVVHTGFAMVGTEREGGAVGDGVVDASLVFFFQVLTLRTRDALVIIRRVFGAGNGVTQTDSVLEVVSLNTRRTGVFSKRSGGAVVLGNDLTGSVSEEEAGFAL